MAPRISTVSFITVFGTPRTLYLTARCANSPATTASAMMDSDSMASLCASATALGQYGQVGVTNTCMWTGLSNCFSAILLASLRPDSPFDASLMASRNARNSYPAGTP